MNVHLRPARPTDAGQVGAILSGFVSETPWMPHLHTKAEDIAFSGKMIDHGWVTVCEYANNLLGFISINRNLVHSLYVLPQCRGQGHGAALLRQAQADATHLTLFTFQANDGAQRFYLRQGFVETGRTDGTENDEGLPDIRYEWHRRTT